jgi:hypothetical protein
MILSNVEIQKAINEGRLIITPEPQARDYDTTAVNLHLGASLAIPKGGSFNCDLTSRALLRFFLAIATMKTFRKQDNLWSRKTLFLE